MTLCNIFSRVWLFCGIICNGLGSNMITFWNESHQLPEPLAESIAGYNSDTKTIWIVGGWNGTMATHICYTYNISSHQYKSQQYSGDRSLIASSYTSKIDYIYFASNYILYEFAMSTNPKFHQESSLPSYHYADSPSITFSPSQKRYLFLTGGRVNGSIVNTLSIYDIGGTPKKWLNITNANMIYPRAGHNCIARNNMLYIFGGYINNTHTTNTIEKLYIGNINNIESEEWELVNATLDNDIAYMRIAEVHNLIYIIGGYSMSLNSSVQTVNILDPFNNDDITTGVPLPQSTYKPAIVVDQANNQIYLFGGHEDDATSESLQLVQISNKFKSSSTGFTWDEIVIVAGLFCSCIALSIIFYSCYQKRKRIYKEGDMALVDGTGSELSDYGAAHQEGMENPMVFDTFHSIDSFKRGKKPG